MRLTAFRIQNFRSIRDTGWCNFSSDNVTCLIGQNESGKSSILEALLSFDTRHITPDDLRSDGSLPSVACCFLETFDFLKAIITDKFADIPIEAWSEFKKVYNGRINIERRWLSEGEGGILILEEEVLVNALFAAGVISDKDAAFSTSNEVKEAVEDKDILQIPTASQFAEAIFAQTPDFALFEDFSSLLPNMIDYSDLAASEDSGVEGYAGAKNLFATIGLDIDKLLVSDRRIRENVISGSSRQFSVDFQEFWQQKIGSVNKIGVEFDLKHHDASVPSKAGKPFVEFWVNDGQEKLYPKQRSKGVRWFLSFYLQLKASKARQGERGTVLLIDEPGSSLHAKAQEDLLKVFEDIKDKVQIVYCTHSPHLVNLSTLYRLLAVQRSEKNGSESDTIIINAHKLGSASADTMLPVYSLMGSDASYQNIVRKTGNVILEEVSAYYYFRAFWHLCGKSIDTIHFLPATGNSNVCLLCNLFLGWGLHFAVVLDDDASSRRIFSDLKKTIYGDDDDLSRQHVYLIDGCLGIEDALTKNDFRKFVADEDISENAEANSKWVKGKAKAVLALQFMHNVEAGHIQLAALEPKSQSKIRDIIAAIEVLKTD